MAVSIMNSMIIKYLTLVTSLSLSVAPLIVLAEPTLLTGTVTYVRDGDTIEVGNIPIKFYGVLSGDSLEGLVIGSMVGSGLGLAVGVKDAYDGFKSDTSACSSS